MARNSGIVLCASMRIDGKTEINYRVYEGGLVEFSVGDGEFGPLTTEPGPRELADSAQEALRAVLTAALTAVTRNDKGCTTD